ncbi:MAG: hypothetical protein IVW57_18955 [Ktedonobacterales bacterium]|nr:hypothetical protein [Ktedonobacterales bacterium]
MCALLAAGLLLAGCSVSNVLDPPPPARTLARSGGWRLVLQASCPPDQPGCDINQRFGATVVILRRRLWEGLGLRDAVVLPLDARRVSIELPGVRDDSQARDLVSRRGVVDVLDTGADYLPVGTDASAKICARSCPPGQYPLAFTGDQFDPTQVSAEPDPQSGQRGDYARLLFGFAGDARQQFATYTRNHVNQYLTITLDGVVLVAATIQAEIDGQGSIGGLASLTQAQHFVACVQYGALPLTISLVSEHSSAPPPAR